MNWRGSGDYMRKKLVIAAIISLVLFIIVIISAFGMSDYYIKFGNERITMDYPVFMHNDRIYVSVRNICDLLGIPIYWDEQENEVHMDVYNKKVNVSDKTEYKEEGVIPDEETALTIGKAILEKYAGRPMEYETEDKIYYLKTLYYEIGNYWRVMQWYDYKDGRSWAAGGQFYCPTVSLNKNTGEVIYLNTYSMYEE